MGDQEPESPQRWAESSPDDPREPQRLSEVTEPVWRYVALRTLRGFMDHQCMDLAAGLTYHAVLSLFPALLAIVSLLGLFGQSGNTVSGMMDIIQHIAPGATAASIRQPVEDLVHAPAAGLALIGGLAGALWAASGYVRAFARAMNRIYGIAEGRSLVRLFGTMLGITVVYVVVVAVVSAVLVLSGPIADAIGNAIGLGGPAEVGWNILKWPAAVVLVVGLIAVLYYFTPNVRQPKFRWMSVGSSIALAVFALATAGFGFYVGNFGHYNRTYGALGGVIILLLWVWLLNMSLLLGAVFDAETERGRELEAGLPAEEQIQLPPKSVAGIRKRQKRAQEDIRRARELRRRHGR
ncbi:YihY/virulence factor BrkB family protein [Sinomonas humi]|uniref:YihY/virulence factor BrkB family protein n=1 Tax=Sinomonas humi TaxID=1338436 RepID=UPI00068922A9|nr:YihY/virulence factor BrkB family protein [Sinomonas humi]